MNISFDFVIDFEKKITINIPDPSEKFNYYYDITSSLNKFDEATALLIMNDRQVVLAKDILDDVIVSFNATLKRALENHLHLPSYLKTPGIGFELNKMLNDKNDYDFSPFWMWSSLTHVQTLIYNYQSEIYLEIIPTCPDVNTDQSDEIIEESFQKFMKNYKPILVTTIPLQIAQDWLVETEKIITMINKN